MIVDRDRFGVVHSEQDLGSGIDAHVMDKGADCVIACLSVAFAYLAAVKDDTDRNTIIGSLSQLATEAVALNRQRDPNAFVIDATVQ